MSKKSYRIFEGLRFAGIQSGNVVYLAYYLAKGNVATATLF